MQVWQNSAMIDDKFCRGCRSIRMEADLFMRNNIKIDCNTQKEKVIYQARPIMADYCLGMGVYFFSLISKLAILFLIGMFAYIFLQSAWNNGLQNTINSTVEVVTKMPWNGWLSFGVAGLLFVALFLAAPVLKWYFNGTKTIFTDRCVHVYRVFREEKIITYEELEACIKNRKIRIENGGFVILCNGTKLKIPLLYEEFPVDLFDFWEKKFGIELPSEDIRSRALRTGAGWAVGHLTGGIILPWCLLIYLAGFLADGPLTWEYAIYYIFYENDFVKVTLVLIVGGLILNLWFVPQAVRAYKEYRDVVGVSLKPILTNVLIVCMFCGGYRYCDYIGWGQYVEEKQVEVSATQVTEYGFVDSFCRDVLQKDARLVTEEELKSVKYLSVDFIGNGRVSVRYSMVDYKDCESEQIFEESIQIWKCQEDEYITLPIDISGFTGLTYLEIPEDEKLNDLILSKESQISRFRIYESPETLLKLVNPQTVEALEVLYYDEEDDFHCLKQCVNLRDLKYENPNCMSVIDLQNLAHPENMERLHMKCGVEYTNLDVLKDALQMKSLYLDTATLEQCDFVTKMSELKELGIIIEKPEDLKEIAVFKDQMSVLHLDIQEWNDTEYVGYGDRICDVSILADMKELRELKVNFGGDWKVTGTEELLDLPKLKSLTLGAEIMADVFLFMDETQLVENTVVEELFLGGCVPWGSLSDECCTETYLSLFSAVKNLSLTDMDSSQAPTSYEFLSGYKNLQRLYLWQVSMTEEQREYINGLGDEIEITCL